MFARFACGVWCSINALSGSKLDRQCWLGRWYIQYSVRLYFIETHKKNMAKRQHHILATRSTRDRAHAGVGCYRVVMMVSCGMRVCVKKTHSWAKKKALTKWRQGPRAQNHGFFIEWPSSATIYLRRPGECVVSPIVMTTPVSYYGRGGTYCLRTPYMKISIPHPNIALKNMVHATRC